MDVSGTSPPQIPSSVAETDRALRKKWLRRRGVHEIFKKHHVWPLGTLKLAGIAADFFLISVHALHGGQPFEASMISDSYLFQSHTPTIWLM
jgi:hypothetical protein